MQKRGQVSEQFNWIFASIAGGIILLLFVFVIGQLQTSGNAQLGITILNKVDTILTGSESTDNAVTIVPINNLFSLSVTCFEDSRLYIEKSQSSMDIGSRILFAPTTVGEKQLFISTRELKRPFPLGNAVLLSDEDILFTVFDPSSGDEQEQARLNEVYALFPDNISKNKIAYFQSSFKSYKHIAVITTVPPPNFASGQETYPGQDQLKNLNVVWIQIPVDANTATVYTKTKSESTFDSGTNVRIPELQFLLFLAHSPSADFYECSLDKLQLKLSTITKIYLERSQQLQDDELMTENRCISRYVSTENLIRSFYLDEASYYNKDTIAQINQANRELLLASCPVIY